MSKAKELSSRLKVIVEEESPANKKAYKNIDKHMDSIIKEIKKSQSEAKKIKPSDEMMDRLHDRLLEQAEQLKRQIIR